jgi:hypothetical protein
MQTYGKIIVFILKFLIFLARNIEHDGSEKKYLIEEANNYIITLDKKTIRSYHSTEQEQQHELVQQKELYRGNRKLIELFVALFAEKNKNNKIALSKEIKLWLDINNFLTESKMSYESFEFGVNTCLDKHIPNLNYAKRASEGHWEKNKPEQATLIGIEEKKEKAIAYFNEIFRPRE